LNKLLSRFSTRGWKGGIGGVYLGGGGEEEGADVGGLDDGVGVVAAVFLSYEARQQKVPGLHWRTLKEYCAGTAKKERRTSQEKML
jgi:hypothetical protein